MQNSPGTNIMIFTLITLIIFVMPGAYAATDGFQERFDFGWTVKVFFQDLGETITSLGGDSAKLKDLRISHMEDAQAELDKREREGKPIPIGIVNRIDDKINQLDNDETIGNTIISTIRKGNEINQIRVLYSEFPEVLDSKDPFAKDRFNKKVNSLAAWKENCSGTFDINNYKNDKQSFEKLSDVCPPLKTETIQKVRSMLYG